MNFTHHCGVWRQPKMCCLGLCAWEFFIMSWIFLILIFNVVFLFIYLFYFLIFSWLLIGFYDLFRFIFLCSYCDLINKGHDIWLVHNYYYFQFYSLMLGFSSFFVFLFLISFFHIWLILIGFHDLFWFIFYRVNMVTNKCCNIWLIFDFTNVYFLNHIIK
jgi:hypothetical protein